MVTQFRHPNMTEQVFTVVYNPAAPPVRAGAKRFRIQDVHLRTNRDCGSVGDSSSVRNRYRIWASAFQSPDLAKRIW